MSCATYFRWPQCFLYWHSPAPASSRRAPGGSAAKACATHASRVAAFLLPTTYWPWSTERILLRADLGSNKKLKNRRAVLTHSLSLSNGPAAPRLRPVTVRVLADA